MLKSPFSTRALLALLCCMQLSLVPAVAQVPGAAVPLVDMDGGCLLGGVMNGQWLKPEEMGPRMSGGDKYRLYDLRGEFKSMTGGKAASQGAPCDDTLYVEFPEGYRGEIPRDFHLIGFAGKWNPMPREPKLERTDIAVYRNLISDLLKRKGIRRPELNLVHIVRIDLEGDGTEEVIISATRVNRYEGTGGIAPDPRPGDYSLVMLRKIVGGKVQTIMLAEEYHPKVKEFSTPNEYDVVAVLDLNGDGVMEVVVSGGYYEGDWKTVYSIKGDKATEVLGCGCGA